MNKSLPVREKHWRPQRSFESTGTWMTDEWKINGLTGQMMNIDLDQDWALYDEDCAWCGHCADSVSY